MSMWATIKDKIKEILEKMLGARTIENVLHVTPAISSIMEEKIQTWTDMYQDRAYWLHEPSDDDPVRIASLGLPALISSEKARMVLIEFQSEITTPTEEVEVDNPDFKEPEPDMFGNIVPSAQPPTIMEEKPIGDTTRGEFLNHEYQKLTNQSERQLEFGIAQGGLIVKPYPVFTNIDETQTYGEKKVVPTGYFEFDFIHADCFYPMAFNANGDITEAAFIQTKAERDTVYRRLEYHKWSGNTVEIINKAFKAQNGSTEESSNNLELGEEIPLTDIPEWKDLQPKVTIKNVNRPLFAYFKMPEANTVDTTSPLGASGFSRAEKLIRDADMQYSRLLWEYEAGEMAIDIDRDALKTEDDGRGYSHTSRPYLQERLMRKVDLGSTGDTYNPFNPTLRDTSYLQGLNAVLMRIEDACSLSRGTLSDATQEAKTATELKILKQRAYQANLRIQKAWEEQLRNVAYIMDVYCTLYNMVGDITFAGDGTPLDTNKGQWDISFEWDDSILTDVDEELNKRINLMSQGIMSKLELRMWYFGETERQAQEALTKAQDESLQSVEENLMVESNMMAQNAKAKMVNS